MHALPLAASTDAPPWLVPAIAGGFLVVFPLLWCGVLFLLSRAGGWGRLAKVYAAGDRKPAGRRHAWAYGAVGWVGYNGALVVHFCEEGFFLETLWLFRPGHPRLFIPWAEVVSQKERRLLLTKYVKLEIGRPRVATVSLTAGLLRDLPAAAGAAAG